MSSNCNCEELEPEDLLPNTARDGLSVGISEAMTAPGLQQAASIVAMSFVSSTVYYPIAFVHRYTLITRLVAVLLQPSQHSRSKFGFDVEREKSHDFPENVIAKGRLLDIEAVPCIDLPHLNSLSPLPSTTTLILTANVR